MKNVCYLSALVLQIKYNINKNVKIKYKNNTEDKIKKLKKTDNLRVTWRKNLIRVIFGFRLGVKDTVRDPVLVLVVWQRIFNRHLKVPWEHVSLIELQTVIKMKVGVCTHETLDKVLTESVSPLGVDPTLDRPAILTCRSRTGKEHDLEG
jgi:hypothetical protein